MGQSLAIPRVIHDDWKRLDLIINKIKMRLGRDSDHTFASLTLSGLTASTLIGANADKTLESITVGTGLDYTRPNLTLSHLGIEALTDPGADKILFWDDSASACKWLGMGNSVAITDVTLDTIQDIRTTASPTFANLNLTETGANDPTILFTSATNSLKIYLDESGTPDNLRIAGQTASQDTQLIIEAKDGERARIMLYSGTANYGYLMYGAADTLTLANTKEDEDLVFSVDDGGVTKTITWDADIDKLKHSAGTFNFDDDNILTSGTLGCGVITQSGTTLANTYQPLDDVLTDLAALTAVADNEFIVGDGAGSYAHENPATAATSMGLGTGDSPQFTAVNIGHASDTTITRVSAGIIAVEGTTVMMIGDAPTAHLHDGDTLECDGINSSAGSFAFDTGGIVTFNESITMSAGKDLTVAGHIIFNTDNSYIGFISPRITFDDTNDTLDVTGHMDITGLMSLGDAAWTPAQMLYALKTWDLTSAADNIDRKGINSIIHVGKTGAADFTGHAVAVRAKTLLDDCNTQDWTSGMSLRGLETYVGVEGSSPGAIPAAVGLYMDANFQDAATVTDYFGIYMEDPYVVNNKLTNAYGIYLKDFNTAQTLNYAIYTNAGLIRFGDAVTGTSTATFAGLTITSSCVLGANSAVFQPATDSTTFFQVLDADGGSPVFNVDTTNEKVGFRIASPVGYVHIRKASAGTITPWLAVDALVIESDGHVGTTLFCPSGSVSTYGFGSPGNVVDGSEALLRWDKANLRMTVGTSCVTGGELRFVTGNFVDAMIIQANNFTGIGITTPVGMFHVRRESAGSWSVPGDANVMIAEHNANSGIFIVSPDATHQSLILGSTNVETGGIIRWDYGTAGANKLMTVGPSVAGADLKLVSGNFIEALKLDSSQNATFAGAINSATLTVTTANDGAGIDVSGVNHIFIDSSGGAISIDDFTLGVIGQMLNIVIVDNTSQVTFTDRSTANQEMYLHDQANLVVAAGTRAGVTLVCDGNDWYDVSHAKHV